MKSTSFLPLNFFFGAASAGAASRSSATASPLTFTASQELGQVLVEDHCESLVNIRLLSTVRAVPAAACRGKFYRATDARQPDRPPLAQRANGADTGKLALNTMARFVHVPVSRNRPIGTLKWRTRSTLPSRDSWRRRAKWI
jgi:hypothetical protein